MRATAVRASFEPVNTALVPGGVTFLNSIVLSHPGPNGVIQDSEKVGELLAGQLVFVTQTRKLGDGRVRACIGDGRWTSLNTAAGRVLLAAVTLDSAKGTVDASQLLSNGTMVLKQTLARYVSAPVCCRYSEWLWLTVFTAVKDHRLGRAGRRAGRDELAARRTREQGGERKQAPHPGWSSRSQQHRAEPTRL